MTELPKGVELSRRIDDDGNTRITVRLLLTAQEMLPEHVLSRTRVGREVTVEHIEEKLVKMLMESLRETAGSDMSKDDVFRALDDCRRRMGLTLDEQARHCVEMCGQVADFMSKGRVEKAMRWLGFIQGWLWTRGLATIDDLRQKARP